MLSLIASILFDYRVLQAFETIVDTFISQENFTKIFVIEEDMALIAEQVSIYGNQLYILSYFLKGLNDKLKTCCCHDQDMCLNLYDVLVHD